ncbi:MAG: ABC transporter permease [Ktedonobacteraceae bacterium]|nr:ABC transporter permease [Ktedonobacteraceae bacterium]
MIQSTSLSWQSNTWRTLWAATRLEWQAQGNWTNPWFFLLLLIVKPLVSALVLVFMYWVISGFRSHGGIFGFLIVGSAAWSFVEQIVAGLSRAVLDDREQYAMLKYVYIAPQSFIIFLIGRSVPRMLAACISFVTTLGFGIGVLSVPIDVRQVHYPLLLFALVIAFVISVALGIALAGLTLMLKRNAWLLPDATVGALYLIAGTIFPITILPAWLEKLTLALPLVYWLELVRRALLGDAVGAAFPIASTSAIIMLLLLTTVVMSALCLATFCLSDYIARERGQIDRATGD